VRRCLLAVAALVSLLAGCAGVRVENGAYVVRRKGYRVGAPAGWTRLETAADVALAREAPSAGLMAHATCEGKAPGRSLPVLARHLRFGLRQVRDLTETPITLGGLSGTASRFRAVLDGLPVAVRAVTLSGPACVYDLVAVAPPGAMGAVLPDFDRLLAGFALVETAP
jgi:hypothetical protein